MRNRIGQMNISSRPVHRSPVAVAMDLKVGLVVLVHVRHSEPILSACEYLSLSDPWERHLHLHAHELRD